MFRSFGRDRLSYGTRFAEAFTVWIMVATMVFFIAAGVVDSSGRDDTHFGAVPSGAVALSADSYLIRDPAKMTLAQQICHPDTGGVESVSPVPDLDGQLYVECVSDQTWNDKRDGSPNFANAMGQVILSPLAWAIGAGMLLFFAFLNVGPPTRHKRKRKREERKQARAAKKALKVEAEDRRLALAAAWAANEIDDETFDKKLSELMPYIDEHKRPR